MQIYFANDPGERKWIILVVNLLATCMAPILGFSTPLLAAYLALGFVVSMVGAYQVHVDTGPPGSKPIVRDHLLPTALRTDGLLNRLAYQTILTGVIMVDAGLLLRLGWFYFAIMGFAAPASALVIGYLVLQREKRVSS